MIPYLPPPSTQPPTILAFANGPYLYPTTIFNMAIDTEEFLHLARPIAPSMPGFNSNISPMTVNLQPQVRKAQAAFFFSLSLIVFLLSTHDQGTPY